VKVQVAPNPNQPVEITQRGRESIGIRWADGHESAYPLPLLRRLCRCAACRAAEPPAVRTTGPFRVLGLEPSAEPARLEPVGRYALGVTWKDGHTSIFAFDSLRQDCPCRTCIAARAGAGS
jgi:DUF971 family protein